MRIFPYATQNDVVVVLSASVTDPDIQLRSNGNEAVLFGDRVPALGATPQIDDQGQQNIRFQTKIHEKDRFVWPVNSVRKSFQTLSPLRGEWVRCRANFQWELALVVSLVLNLEPFLFLHSKIFSITSPTPAPPPKK